MFTSVHSLLSAERFLCNLCQSQNKHGGFCNDHQTFLRLSNDTALWLQFFQCCFPQNLQGIWVFSFSLLGNVIYPLSHESKSSGMQSRNEDIFTVWSTQPAILREWPWQFIVKNNQIQNLFHPHGVVAILHQLCLHPWRQGPMLSEWIPEAKPLCTSLWCMQMPSAPLHMLKDKCFCDC